MSVYPFERKITDIPNTFTAVRHSLILGIFFRRTVGFRSSWWRSCVCG